MALDANKVISAYGWNRNGQLGLNLTVDAYDFEKIVNFHKPIIKIAAGFAHSLALDTEGNLFLWGKTAMGQPDSASSGTSIFFPTNSNLSFPVLSVVAGKNFSLILTNGKTRPKDLLDSSGKYLLQEWLKSPKSKLNLKVLGFGENVPRQFETKETIITTPTPLKYKDLDALLLLFNSTSEIEEIATLEKRYRELVSNDISL